MFEQHSAGLGAPEELDRNIKVELIKIRKICEKIDGQRVGNISRNDDRSTNERVYHCACAMVPKLLINTYSNPRIIY